MGTHPIFESDFDCLTDVKMSSIDDDSSVKVAIRIRPQLAREQIEGSRVCTFVAEGQVTLGKDKSFTYDYVFDLHQTQHDCYTGSVTKLVAGCFDGFNATVIAYGQTGAGKTHTMGTGFEMDIDPSHEGMIPRALRQIFDGIKHHEDAAGAEKLMKPEFNVSVQFMEIYQEEIIDLLNNGQQRKIRIHEDQFGNIIADGLIDAKSTSFEQTMKLLQSGALNRTTASTKMNTQSSRSHAVFTLNIAQTRMSTVDKEVETVCSKFHFVDLAGSERLKRTGATGDRAKEGISINSGLLALGNVISALGDKSKKSSHVPYRDSKITRLLQDSLGGNSRTIMIACISPSDSDFMETLNTLKYANRARNIKNKVTKNQDSTSKQIAILREQLQTALSELAMYKSGVTPTNGGGDGAVGTDVARFNELQATIDLQKDRLVSLQMNNVKPDNIETSSMIQNYIQQIEELNNKLAQAEARAARPRIGSARETVLSNASAGLIDKARKAMLRNGTATSSSSTVMSESGIMSDEDEDGIDDELDIESQIENNEELKCLESSVIKRKEEIADISEEINLNEELVIRLEATMANFESEMEHQRKMYESKLQLLVAKIKQAEEDRDNALKQTIKQTDSSNPKIKEMSEKIKNYKHELKTLHESSKEAERRAKAEQTKLRQLAETKKKLDDMKRQKVEMIKKMKEEAKQARDKEKDARKEIIQIKKTMRQTESLAAQQGNKLQSQDELLKRRGLEIQTLKKKIKEDQLKSKKLSSTKGNIRPVKNADVKNPKIWGDLKSKIQTSIIAKETSQNLEFDLQRLMKERKSMESQPDQADHLDYVNNQIEETQQSLCDLADDDSLINASELGAGDLRYVVTQLLPFFINCQSQSNIEKRQLTKNLQKMRVEVENQQKMKKTQEQILSFLMKDKDSSSLTSANTPTAQLKTKRRPRLSKAGALGLGEEETMEEPSSPLPQIKSVKIDSPRSSTKSSRLGTVWNRLTSKDKDSKTTTGKVLPFCSTSENAEGDSNPGLNCKKVMVGHSKPIVALHASPDGQYLISSSKDKSVKVWDLVALKEMGSITLSSSISVIEYRDNVLYLAEGNKLHIYDIYISFEKSMKSLQEMKNINFVKIDAHNRLYTIQDKAIKCYEDLNDLKGLRFQSTSEITAFAVNVQTPTQSELIFGCRDHFVRRIVHNYQGGSSTEAITFEPPHLDTVTGIVCDAPFIYSISRDHSLVKWSDSGERLQIVSNIHSDWIINICLRPESPHLLTNSRDGSVKVWNKDTLNCIGQINQLKEPDGISSICANASTLFTGAQTKNIKMWGVTSPS